MEQVTIRNVTRATVIGTRIAVADTFLHSADRVAGTQGARARCGPLDPAFVGRAYFGMLFPIDVIALDRKLRVCAVWPKLRPWRISGVSWRIHSVIELPTGSIQRGNIQRGDQLEVLDTQPLSDRRMQRSWREDPVRNPDVLGCRTDADGGCSAV